jgi:hypothetical protein
MEKDLLNDAVFALAILITCWRSIFKIDAYGSQDLSSRIVQLFNVAEGSDEEGLVGERAWVWSRWCDDCLLGRP